MKPPSNLSHLEKLIGAWGDEESDTTTARLRRLIGVSVLVGILDGLRDGDGNPRLALKGGADLELRLGHVARSSSDVDAVVNFGIDEAFTEIGVLLQTGWQGFTGTLGDRLPITRPR